MAFRIEYKRSVWSDIKNLDRQVAARVIREIEAVLTEHPEQGDALTGQFRGLYRYRVGDWRVIYAIRTDSVLILRIRHRSVAYH